MKALEKEGTLKRYYLLPATLGEFYSQMAHFNYAHSYFEEALYKMAEMYYIKENYNKAIDFLNQSLLIKENFYRKENK